MLSRFCYSNVTRWGVQFSGNTILSKMKNFLSTFYENLITNGHVLRNLELREPEILLEITICQPLHIHSRTGVMKTNAYLLNFDFIKPNTLNPIYVIIPRELF